MNVDNIRTTIESLRASTTYDQTEYNDDCGTPACIAGHAVIDAGLILKTNLGYCYDVEGVVYDIEEAAATWLGFGGQRVADLFSIYPLGEKTVTKEDAIAVLENLIETGEVDWSICNEREGVPQ